MTIGWVIGGIAAVAVIGALWAAKKWLDNNLGPGA